MGLAHTTSTNPGIMGVGFRDNEASAGRSNFEFPNLVDTMVNQSVINSQAYSLWLDDIGESNFVTWLDDKSIWLTTFPRRPIRLNPLRRYRHGEILRNTRKPRDISLRRAKCVNQRVYGVFHVARSYDGFRYY